MRDNLCSTSRGTRAGNRPTYSSAPPSNAPSLVVVIMPSLPCSRFLTHHQVAATPVHRVRLDDAEARHREHVTKGRVAVGPIGVLLLRTPDRAVLRERRAAAPEQRDGAGQAGPLPRIAEHVHGPFGDVDDASRIASED